MKTSATVSVNNGVLTIKFDIFEAVWGYLLFDNIGVLADSKTRTLKLLSFSTGKEQTTVELSKSDFEKLSESKSVVLNFALGDENTAVYKFEGGIDTTGKFIEAIEAQFAGKNATAIECYKAVLETNPVLYRAYGLLGRCLRAEGNPDKAFDCYKKAIDLAPWSPEAYCNMGVLHQKNGEEEQAQNLFERAIDADNFYTNALLKRAAYLLKNSPEEYELRLINLRLSTTLNDVAAVQQHIKAYMEKMGYDRVAYSDKETALFGDYANPKLQQKLKKIEGFIINGAFQAASTAIIDVLAFSKGTSAEKKVAGWCHERALRMRSRLGEGINDRLFREIVKILEETPSAENLRAQAEADAKAEAAEAAKHIDKEAAEAARKAAIAAIENDVSKDGDYTQAIAGPVEKELTEEERANSLAEAAFIEEAVEMPAPAPVSQPAPELVDEAPAPVEAAPSVEDYINEGPAPAAPVSSVEAYVNEGPAPVAPVATVEAYADEGPAPAAPVSSVEAYVNEGPAPVAPSPAENSAEELPKPVLSNDYKSPIKEVKPITIQEFFILTLFEVMRDGEIEEGERQFLSQLKNGLKISDTDFNKMFVYVRNKVKASGVESGEKGKFDIKRIYKNLCKAAWRDGVLEESEKKILVMVSKLFRFSGEETKKMILEAKK